MFLGYQLMDEGSLRMDCDYLFFAIESDTLFVFLKGTKIYFLRQLTFHKNAFLLCIAKRLQA